MASRSGHFKVVKTLVEAKASIDGKGISSASSVLIILAIWIHHTEYKNTILFCKVKRGLKTL